MRTIVGDRQNEYDVIVVGSGASGLSTAAVAARHGLRVIVLEKAAQIGGTSAVSGGMVWVPGTRQVQQAQIRDNTDDALAYVTAVARGRGHTELARSVIENGSVAIAYLEDECALGFRLLEDFPDYRQDLPGAAQGGRTLEPALYDASDLGPLIAHIRSDGRPPFTMQEYERWGAFTRFPWEDLERRSRRGILAKGRALVAGLVASLVRDDATIAVGAPVERITIDDGRPTGVQLTDGTAMRAQVAVVLATGGFEWDSGLLDSMVQSRIYAVCSPPANTGDGLRMAQRLGAQIRGTREAWWAPMARVGDQRDGKPIGTLLRFERQGPGSIMVNRSGRRFANESQNYNDLARALHSWDPAHARALNTPAYIIFDARYLKEYGLFDYRYGDRVPDYLTYAPDLEGLAEQLALPATALTRTVERFNGHAIAGTDPDFGRGESAYDKYWGDVSNPWPNASMAPLAEAPYFALEVVNGAFGTSGGVVTDGKGRVLDVDGEPIPGLFAGGNVTESAYAAGYPGAGATLGPIVTLGYLIGHELAALARASNV